MDTDALVEEALDEGQKFTEALLQRGFDVTAAFWLKAADNDKWYYYVVSPVVDAQGTTEAYRRLHPLVHAMPRVLWIDPLKIRLIGAKDPIASDVLAAIRRLPGPRSSPIRWGGRMLGNISIDGAYLYPLPVTTP